MTNTLTPSDILVSATDEVGSALAVVRSQALAATGEAREQLLEEYKKLIKKLQRLMILNLKEIDNQDTIVQAVQDLTALTQQMAKARREMADATSTIEKTTQILKYVDEFIKVLVALGLLA
ncbi:MULTISPECIES: hypothetical protein [unclassified Pseudomonas]|uniref:hypothetical protein n=1 Tax=unclassified Pseudomonas TaxID=196821 RepID=UPI000A1E9A2A|nr:MULTISPECIES: hypothetical protein [unclassified Pseudomonas]